MVIIKCNTIGWAMTRLSPEREVIFQILGRSNLAQCCHRCNISSKGAVLPGRNDAEMGPANSLHALAWYSEYHERIRLFLSRYVTYETYLENANLFWKYASAKNLFWDKKLTLITDKNGLGRETTPAKKFLCLKSPLGINPKQPVA